MADGKIVIETELDSKNLEKGIDNIKSKVSSTSGSFRSASIDGSKSFKDIEKSSNSSASNIESTWKSKLSSIGSMATSLATTAVTGVSTALAGLGGYALKVGSDFEAGMSQVSATMGFTVDQLHDSTSQQAQDFARLEQAAKDMGATTQFSASQAAEALNYEALAGYDVDKSISMLPNVLNLAAAGGMELGTACDMVTDASSALGLTTEQTTQLVDQMAKTSQKSNTSVSQLGEAILTVGGTANTLKGGMTEMNTALGEMANVGLKGAEGGTHLRNIILSLSAPTDVAAGALETLGIKTEDANGNLLGLNEIMGQLNTKLSSYGTSEKAAWISKIFNKTDLTAVQGLMMSTVHDVGELGSVLEDAGYKAEDHGKKISDLAGAYDKEKDDVENVNLLMRQFEMSEDQAKLALEGLKAVAGDSTAWDELSANIEDSTGSAEEQAKTMMDNLQGQITLLKSALEGFGIDLYQSMDNPMKDVVKSANSMVSEMSEAFAAGGFEGLTYVLGDVFANIAEGVADFLPTMIDAATNVISAFLDGINDNSERLGESGSKIIDALVRAVITLAPKLLETGVTLISAIGKGISEGLSNSFPGIGELLTPIKDAFDVIIENSSVVTAALIGIGAGIAVFKGTELIIGFITAIKEGTTAVKALEMAQAALNVVMAINPFVLIISAVAALVAALIYLWNTNEEFRNAIISAWNSIKDTFVSVWYSVTSFFTETIPSAFDSCVSAIEEFGNSIMSFFTEDIPQAFESLQEWFSNLPETIAYSFGEAVGSVLQFVTDLGTSISEGVPQIIDDVGTWFSELPNRISEALSSAIDSVSNWASETYNTATNAVSNAVNEIVNWFNNLPSNISSALNSALQALISWGSNLVSEGTNAATNTGNAIVNGLNSIPGKMAEIGRHIVDGLKNGVMSAWGNLTSAVSNLASNFIAGVKAKFDIHSPSRVMRDQVGKMIVAGINVGIDQEIPSLLNTSYNMANSCIYAIDSSFKKTDFTKYTKDAANQLLIGMNTVTGVYQGLVNELNSANNAVNNANNMKVEDNIWYADSSKRLDEVKSQIDDLKDKISETEDKSTKESLQKQHKVLEKQKDSIQKEVDYYKQAAKEEIEVCKENAKQQLAIAKQKQEKLELMIKGVTEALKEQLTQEKEARIKSIEDEMSAAETAYNNKCDLIDKEAERKVSSIQKKIDAMQEEEKEEDRLKEKQQANNEIAVLQAKMQNTKSEADKRALALKIKNAQASLSEKEKEWEKEDTKDALQAKIDNINAKAERKKNALKEEYEATKENLEKEKKATEEHYKTLLEADNLNAQVRYTMLTKSNDELVTLLQSYNPLWQNAGQSLSDSLLNGLNSNKQSIADAVAEMTSMRGGLYMSGYAAGTSSNPIAGMYNVDEKGFELSTNNNPVAYVSRGAGILNHMQSLKAVKEEVSSQVANQMQYIKSMILGQQNLIASLAGTVSNITNSSTDNSIGQLLHVENMHVNNKNDIKGLASELGFYADKQRKY